MGALGMLYGKNMTEALGYDNVRFCMNRERYERNKDIVCSIQGEEFRFNLVPSDEATVSDLVLVAVKYPGLDSAIEDMRPCVGKDTVIMSVLNGISSENIIAEAYGAHHMINTVAQGMDATNFDHKLNYSNQGTLFIGEYPGGASDNIDRVVDALTRSSLDYKVEEDIRFRIWSKYMLNVGINQTCMVYGVNYGGAMNDEEPHYIMISAMREVVAVANAEGIPLTEKDLNFYVDLVAGLKKDLMPSMAQDRINQKPSEVEAFSGTLTALARKHGILVPVNEYLNRRAHEIESEYLSKD